MMSLAVCRKLCVGKGDGDEYDQSKQGPPGRHGGWTTDAGRPAPQGRTTQGFLGEDPHLRPGEAAVNQPRSGPSIYPGESVVDTGNLHMYETGQFAYV